MPSDASNPKPFTGEFRHGIDPKNRITIPADWRSGDGASFYLRIDSTGSYIRVMPPEEFRKTKEKIEALPSASTRERDQMLRQFAADILACSADKQGRMVLPPEFCSRIGLQDEVVLVGVIDRFEIWNSARYAASKAAEAPAYSNFANQLGL